MVGHVVCFWVYTSCPHAGLGVHTCLIPDFSRTMRQIQCFLDLHGLVDLSVAVGFFRAWSDQYGSRSPAVLGFPRVTDVIL